MANISVRREIGLKKNNRRGEKEEERLADNIQKER